jgi:hydrogenase maturation protein HypF
MSNKELYSISVRGVVQGVGFRPFVYRLAHDHGLTGWVLNHSGGVDIEVEGPGDSLSGFVHDLTDQAPPLARIVAVDVAQGSVKGFGSFEIRHSVAEEGRYQLISPDIATCKDCLTELLSPGDRRYRYPFTNCTNCGPRFTIIRDIPYDRPLTTMQPFPMCTDCQREYDDPLDRRFHAQPNACPVCGPHVWLEDTAAAGAPVAERQKALEQAAVRLLAGDVLAIKGLGGFHLACDATNGRAVKLLRTRKGRPAKPLAVMMSSLASIQDHCHVSEEEEALLTSQQCPIVLLRWRSHSSIARSVAPGNRYLGVMLPYTPLHHILLRDVDRPLVMTSGNLSEEPIAQNNKEARQRLGRLADAFLLHNREIYARYDDSVVLVADLPAVVENPHTEQPTQFLRRSRGYAPFPVRLPLATESILAVGAELKNTFCLTRDDFCFISQHVGDMENLETLEHFETSISLFKHLYRIEPRTIAYDMHPNYAATKYALQLQPEEDSESPAIRRVAVQHHHAHIAACLADNGWPPQGTGEAAGGPVIGVAWDGTGYGSDGHIWGGEFFTGEYGGFERAAHLEYLPMPGGEAAIRNPWRLAAGYVHALTGNAPKLEGIDEQQLLIVQQMVDSSINSPLTSAAGRLFDAVAALCGVRQVVTYEAQAAIELEMMSTGWAGRNQPGGGLAYPFDLEQTEAGLVIRLRRMLQAIQADLASGKDAGQVGWQFHLSLADLILAVCQHIASETGLQTVALSGGCFQNRLLLDLVVPKLEGAAFRVLLHQQVPCNDGCISLGQAVMAQAQLGVS